MSNQTPEKLGILVHLDDLLDTRLAVLSLIHKDLPKLALDAGYFLRDEDSFPYVDKEKFEKFYKQRNGVVLQEAVPTRVIPFLREMVRQLSHQAIDTPFHNGPKIYLNVYPYDLTPSEVELLVKVISIKTGKICDVTAVHMSPAEITPYFCRANLGCIFFYNASEWLETHATNDLFRKCQIPDVTLYTPAIYHGRRPTEDELTNLAVHKLTPFRAFEISCSAIVTCSVLDTIVFSVDLDRYTKNGKAKV